MTYTGACNRFDPAEGEHAATASATEQPPRSSSPRDRLGWLVRSSIVLRFKPPKISHGPLPPPTWPEWPDRVGGVKYVPLFSPRPRLRKLQVMVDIEILERAAAKDADDFDDLLAGLLHHELVCLFRYRDGGPPAGEIDKGSSPMPGVPDGWVVGPKRVPPPETSGRLAVQYWGCGHGCTTGFNVSSLRVAEADREHNPYHDLPYESAANQRALDVVAARSAASTAMDLFITERPYLYSADWDAAGDVVIAAPSDALPLVSLYLRAQDRFHVRLAHRGKPGSNINLTRGAFYLTATHELLPTIWRWFGACEQHAQATNDESLLYLAAAVFHRVSRALQARDRVHFAVNAPHTGESGDDALDAIDQMLMLLMGAVDVTARVAYRALGLDATGFAKSWQDKRFRVAVRTVAPELADLFHGETPHRLILTNVLAKLRNTIHGPVLPEIRQHESLRPESSWVGLPGSDAEAILHAIDRLGGRELWGVTESQTGEFQADPGSLADQVIIRTVNLLNAVQAETPVERMQGVTAGHATPDPTDELLGIDGRRRVRLQLGF
jgi:hypothetical protein